MSDTDTPIEDRERIAKRMARAGACSRRDAERWIADGRVSVNGEKLTSPAVLVGPNDIVMVDGAVLPEPEPARLWRYHKPAGLVTTHRDPEGRPTIFSSLPEGLPRVISVGRLDLTSEGLLLLTNDGELARKLELPATGWVRRYRVRVHGMVDEAQLRALSQGITIDGVRYGGIDAVLDRQQGSNAWLTMGLREGKNREIRRVMEYLGYSVSRLLRISYGPFQLGLLEPGQVEEVPRRVLRDQIGTATMDGAEAKSADRTGTAKAKPRPKSHGKPPPKPRAPQQRPPADEGDKPHARRRR